LFGEEHGEALWGAVVRDEARDDGDLEGGELLEAALDGFEEVRSVGILVWAEGGGVLGADEGLLGGVLAPTGEGELWGGVLGGLGLELVEWGDDVGEDGAFAVAWGQGDHGVEVEGLDPVAPGVEDDRAGQT